MTSYNDKGEESDTMKRLSQILRIEVTLVRYYYQTSTTYFRHYYNYYRCCYYPATLLTHPITLLPHQFFYFHYYHYYETVAAGNTCIYLHIFALKMLQITI